MWMCTLGGIFQDKLDDLIGYIKGVKTYIDDLLFLIKERLYENIEQPRVIFGRLRAEGLKVNATKWIWGQRIFLTYAV